MGHEFFTNEELKSWQSWMDSPASPPLSPSGVKKFTPDYENLDRDKAIEDFRERIKHYEDSYEELSIEKEGLVGITVISPSNHFATKKSLRHQRIVCLHSITYLGFFTFSSSLCEFEVEPNTNLSILYWCPLCRTLLQMLKIGSVNVKFDIYLPHNH